MGTDALSNMENEVLGLMQSTQRKYFPELTGLVFQVEKRADIDGVAMRVVMGTPIKVFLYYDDDRVLEYRYRFGLIPIIGHELAHLINPVDPEQVLAERLPGEMVKLWVELRQAGLALCSMDAHITEGG